MRLSLVLTTSRLTLGSGALFDMLIAAEMASKWSAFYRNGKFIIVLTRQRHWSLFRATWIHSTPKTLFKVHFNITLPSARQGLPVRFANQNSVSIFLLFLLYFMDCNIYLLVLIKKAANRMMTSVPRTIDTTINTVWRTPSISAAVSLSGSSIDSSTSFSPSSASRSALYVCLSVSCLKEK